MKNVVYNLSHASLLSAAFFSENWDYLRSASKDCMHEHRRMTQKAITDLCHQHGITDEIIIREIIAVARAFDGSINRQYREVVEYIRAVRELV